MISQRRIDGFVGTDHEYIAYLESKYLELKAQSSIAHPGPPSPPPSFDGDNDFKIFRYEPCSSTQGSSQPPRPAKKQRTQERWQDRLEEEMDAMLRDINNEDLALRRKRVGLSLSSDILMALDLIVDGKTPRTERVTSDTNISVVCYNPSNAIVQLLDSFAVGTAALGIETAFLAQVYHFRILVLVSSCCVALDRGVPMIVVEDIMRKCVSESTAKNLSRLRGGALWVNRMMSALAAVLGHLAYELFILWGAPIAQYGRFGARGEVVSQRFRTGVKINKPGLEMQAALPFFVPYIIKTIVGDIYSLSDICTALGYGELPAVDYPLWHDYQQRKIPLPQGAIVDPTHPRGEGSFDGSGSAKEKRTTSSANNKSTGAHVTPSNEESASTRLNNHHGTAPPTANIAQTSEHPRHISNGLAALITACSQHPFPSISAAPVGAPDLVSSVTQLHSSMAEPGGVDPLVGVYAVDRTDQEQLTRSDLQHELPSNVFNAGESWDCPQWLDIDLPLFSAHPHFDLFGNPEQPSENHSVEA